MFENKKNMRIFLNKVKFNTIKKYIQYQYNKGVNVL